ncbi:MAG: hypothetical protein UX45_C0034G0010 [Candidatus Uhrbacteria bacterium GW2011_GWF2_46_218]|uniref:Uncharacterized protein n=1 Tax=Candidatus Uhrbacteria bacterium GW2011_GWF2_46_218 TaxID=1619001 RepID=A0A0G1PDT6_9BACT|nr:MAG: hypothetical protein UX45_C0034G0010 [Candidatus Uhrbacteria bacterium GW2011_GWF2_46_218]
MNLTEVQLKEIESLSGIFLEPEEIAILLDLDEAEFMNDIRKKKGNIWNAYFRGKTESKKDIHTNIVKMAKHGSPQAEEMAKQMITQQTLAERRAKRDR